MMSRIENIAGFSGFFAGIVSLYYNFVKLVNINNDLSQIEMYGSYIILSGIVITISVTLLVFINLCNKSNVECD